MKVKAMNVKSVFTAIGMLAAGVLSAATLNVELTVSHGIESPDGGKSRGRRVVYFVVDRSGSMDDASLEGGRKPNDALLDSLKMRLSTLPDGTTVHVIPFASVVKAIQSYPALNGRIRSQIVDFVARDKPYGQTLLYDAQDLALTEAARTMQRDQSAEVSVYVYTDGLHLTPYNYEGEYLARSQLRKKKGRGFETNPNYVVEKETAFKKFKAKFADMFAKPSLEIEYEWLSRSQPPDTSDWGTKPRIATEVSSTPSALENPHSAPNQTLKCSLFIPITDGCWNEVKGSKMSLDFELDGRRVSKAFTLSHGKQVVTVDWPSLPKEKSTARLSFSHMPGGKKFELKPPSPVELPVSGRKSAMVRVVSPSPNATVALGADLKLAAVASDGTQVKWTFTGAHQGSIEGSRVDWKAKATGRIVYTVTAFTPDGRLAPATETGSFEVIPTGVEIVSTEERYEVGKECVCRAKSVGPCLRYVWSLDGRRVPGDKDVLKCSFEKSGKHQIAVTAVYKAGITKDAAPKDVSVSAAPFIDVLSPVAYDGDAESAQYRAEKPIELLARVEGDLNIVAWQFKLKDKISTVRTEVKDGRSVGNFVPAKGGFYDVIATAKGSAGEKSKTIQVFVKSAEVHADIVEPKANQDIETGKEFELVATVKGPIKSIRWKMVDKTTAKSFSFGPSDVSAVVDGKSTMKAKLPLEVGNTSVEILAEPVVEDQDLAEAVEPSSVTIEAMTSAKMDYTPKAWENNWKRVKYGEQELLAVETSGAVGEVSWFMVNAGKEISIPGKGKVTHTPAESPDGKTPERMVDYFAKGKMPDGSFIKTKPITLVHYCPPIQAVIQQPTTNGVIVASIGKKTDYAVTLKPADGEKFGDVVWDMGDGSAYTNLTSVKHAYADYGTYAIKAKGVCSKCGGAFEVTAPSAVVVEKQPISAAFSVRPSGTVAQGRQVVLVNMDSPDIARREWTCNDVVIRDEKGNPKTDAVVEYRCTEVGDVVLGLTVFDADGNSIGPITHKLRVYRLWVVILAVLLALLVAGFFWYYFSGDDPRFWKVSSYVDEANGKGPSDVGAEMPPGKSIVKYWDTMRNKATIPLHKLGGAQDADWGQGSSLGQASLVLWEANTAATDGRGVRKPSYDILNAPDGMEKESFSNGQLIHIWVPSPSNDKAVTALWVKIKMRRDVPNTYLWIRFGILLLSLLLAFGASLLWAF